MRIVPLSEGAFTIDQTKEFIPFDKSADELQERTRGSLLVEIQPFLVITKNDLLLLDTGLGFTDANGVLQIHQNLANNGINPSDITKVLMTHLHKDHAGGMVYFDRRENKYKAAFPGATYYINKKEWDFALSNTGPSYDMAKIQTLLDTGRVSFIENDLGQIDDYIFYELSAGHSPCHQIFFVKEDDQVVFFGGDEAPQLQQMKTRYVAKYDNDGKRAMAKRQQWWEQAQQEGWTFLFYHDIKQPTYHFPLH